MASGSKIYTGSMQQLSFSRRMLVVGGAQAAVGLALAARMGYLSIAENERYRTEAESNRVNLTLIPPRRGWLLDRNGVALASNRADFRIDIIPDRLVDEAATLAELQRLLGLTPQDVEDLREAISKANGFQPVEVAAGLDWDRFAAVSVRLPDLPGVAPQRGFSRFYPTGASVGHLIGYVGAASAEDYERDRNPLLITPGFKIGKNGLEKQFEARLRGAPGAKRSEVTASGKIVRDLETRQDVPGKPVALTIDGGLQDYTSRRIGLESGAAVVIDCETGGILALSSMPCFDPNSFSDGIGKLEWRMMQEDERNPLLNKSMQGLYPPGSTLKPMAALAFQMAGQDPEETVYCNGGYRLGNRRFQCLAHHGAMNMTNAIMKSCNTYFYAMAHRYGYDKIAPYARLMGLGEKYDLPMPSQYFGTVPDSEWLLRKHKRQWGAFDSLNATIGQGYVLTSPLQLAVMAARIASGRHLQPSLVKGRENPGKPLPFTPEQLAVVRRGMDLVVNGAGTAVRSRLGLPGITMAGKTGTAQVRGLAKGRSSSAAARKYRDHGLFVFYAPADAPRYAGAVVIEHGMGGARAAAPVAKDLMTYLFDPQRALDTLHRLESGWGGTVQERMARQYAAYEAQYGNGAATTPTPDPSATPTPSPTPSPSATASAEEREERRKPASVPNSAVRNTGEAAPASNSASGADAGSVGTENSASIQPSATPSTQPSAPSTPAPTSAPTGSTGGALRR